MIVSGYQGIRDSLWSTSHQSVVWPVQSITFGLVRSGSFVMKEKSDGECTQSGKKVISGITIVRGPLLVFCGLILRDERGREIERERERERSDRQAVRRQKEDEEGGSPRKRLFEEVG